VNEALPRHSCRGKDPFAEQAEVGSAMALSLEDLDSRDVAFDLA
jgi:hypothetical protein